MEVQLDKIVGGGYNQFFNNKNFYRVVKGSRGSKNLRRLQLILFIELWSITGQTYLLSDVLVILTSNRHIPICVGLQIDWESNLFKFNDSLPEITYKPTGQKYYLEVLMTL